MIMWNVIIKKCRKCVSHITCSVVVNVQDFSYGCFCRKCVSHVTCNVVVNVQDFSYGCLCRKCVSHVTCNVVVNVQDFSYGRLCRKFVSHVTWSAVVNVKDTSTDRDTGHLYQHFMWFQQEIKRKCITNMSCTFWVIHDSRKFQFVPCGSTALNEIYKSGPKGSCNVSKVI